MKNTEAADMLEQVAVFIELREDNPFRARAYHNAARAVQNLPQEFGDLLASGEIARVSGLGKEMRSHLDELHRTGTMILYEELMAAIEPGMLEMLQVPGLGPKRIRMLTSELQISTLSELAEACRQRRVAQISGFGAKTEANILKGIDFLTTQASLVRIDIAEQAALPVIEYMQADGAIKRISLAGSIRRRKELVHDVDAVASIDSDADRGRIMDRFTSYPSATDVLSHGETKSTIVLSGGIKMDLRVVLDAEYATALHHFTGSKEHHVALRGLANAQGLKINEYGLWRDELSLPVSDEKEFYRHLDLDYIEPELREDRGEIAAARDHLLPELITEQAICGILHCHTTYSDGRASLRNMAEACRQQGYRYIGISDHSQVAAYANGLTPERVREQHAEIDQLNAEYAGKFTIFKGTECDILKDGHLDYDDETLATFDFVIASVHSVFGISEEEQTQRIIRALQNPYVTFLGHLTGRLLGRREGYQVDIPRILEEAGKRGVGIEINANPHRLDLDWRWHRIAVEYGIRIPVCPDAHTVEGLHDMRYGIGIARKGWLTRTDIPNAWETEQITEWFAEVRQRGMIIGKP